MTLNDVDHAIVDKAHTMKTSPNKIKTYIDKIK